jgi:hypothetical protein
MSLTVVTHFIITGVPTLRNIFIVEMVTLINKSRNSRNFTELKGLLLRL